MTHLQVPAPDGIELNDSILLEGDVRLILPRLPSNSVQCVVTSPPYWGLRDYGIDGQIGLEGTMAGFLRTLTGIFAEVRRILKPDGILWLNIGDGFTSGNRGWRAPDKKNPNRAMSTRPDNPPGLKDKDLLGIPWRLAFALQDDGWYLRSDVVWNKPNAMPESVKDRPTRAHEYMFMLTKSEHYTYHHESVKETAENGSLRNRRSVWNINTCSTGSSHIASFPPSLVEPCIAASTSEGDFVLDPFFGSGTVGIVAQQLGRRYAGIELNPTYLSEAIQRLKTRTNGFEQSIPLPSDEYHEPELALNEPAGLRGGSPRGGETSLPAPGAVGSSKRRSVVYTEPTTRRKRSAR
jgi:site-specific DNA-methyltransferase (cytosine-N4-specific)